MPPNRMFKREWSCANWSGWRAALAVAGAGAADAQQTPRKGGTIRMTAPYGASFASLDTAHHAARAGRHRRQGAPPHPLQLGFGGEQAGARARDRRSPSRTDGLAHTFKLRDDAFFHNGRKMTADDIIWSFTRIMDGSKGYPGAR